MNTIIGTVLMESGEQKKPEFVNIIVWDSLSEFKSEKQLKDEVVEIAKIHAITESVYGNISFELN